MHQPRGEHAVARGLDESKLDAALSFINHHSQPFRRGEAGLSLRLLIMSAEAFEALQKEIDPTNRAFNDHMNAVTREYERLQSLQRELQEDDRSFNAVMQKARVRLEGTSKSLSAAYSKRSRLQKELERCNEEISSLEADKHKTSDKIQALTRRGTEQREKKLRELGGAGGGSAPSPVAAASVASQGGPSVDLMGGDLMGEASASSAAPHEDDLLGGSHGIDLMSELALAPPAQTAPRPNCRCARRPCTRSCGPTGRCHRPRGGWPSRRGPCRPSDRLHEQQEQRSGLVRNDVCQ